jgi:hypothetical protein
MCMWLALNRTQTLAMVISGLAVVVIEFRGEEEEAI